MHNKFFFFLKKAHLLDTKNFMVYLLAKQKNEGSNLLSFLHFFFLSKPHIVFLFKKNMC